MPILKSAQKQVRVSARRHVRNKSIKSAVNTNLTKAENMIGTGNIDAAKQAVNDAISSLDRAAEKGIIHENNASRRKSRLMKKLNQKATAPAQKTESEAAK